MGGRRGQPKPRKGGKSVPSARSAPSGRGVGRWVWLGLALIGAFLVFEYVRLPDAAPLRTQNPKMTALMEQRAAEAREAGHKPRRKQYWVGLPSVAKSAIAAVILSEDSSFYQHGGVDLDELQKALQDAWEKHELGRGASTITQQLAKNLWLSTDRSLFRKAREVLLARRLEAAMPKNRILTLYMNVVEWGDGVYGIEAAAREHFGVSASQLTPAQGAILAAMLPAPRKRTPTSGSPALRHRAHWIIEQMQYIKLVTADEGADAHREIDQRLGWTKPDADEPDDDES